MAIAIDIAAGARPPFASDGSGGPKIDTSAWFVVITCPPHPAPRPQWEKLDQRCQLSGSLFQLFTELVDLTHIVH